MSALPTITPEHGSRQINAYACLIITFSAATITLVLRLIARKITKVSLWIDDYLAMLAWLSAASWFGLELWWLQSGLGLFLSEIDLSVETALGRTKFLLWITELIYAISLGSSKLSILAFYWRMFKTTQLKRPIQILAGCALVWITFRLFMTTFHCIPVEKFWRSEIPGHCDIDSSKFFFGTVLVHFFIDITVLALPMIEVRKLQLPIRQKLGVMSMFCFGFFVCAASIVVMVLSNHLDQTSIEVPWNISPIVIWATAEVNLAVVSACLPMLRPIYLVILRRPLSSFKSSNGQSYGNSKQQSRGIVSSHKLATLTTTKDVDKSETESTHKLATGGGSMTSSTEDLERALHGNVTVVGVGGSRREDDLLPRAQDASPGDVARGGRDGSPPGERRWNTMGGILVTNEMSVRSDRIQ